MDERNSQSLKQWETTVSEGKAKVEKEYQDALAKWNATVEADKSKIESEYDKALAAYNAEVDKIKQQNDTIRQQNEAVKIISKRLSNELQKHLLVKSQLQLKMGLLSYQLNWLDLMVPKRT